MNVTEILRKSRRQVLRSLAKRERKPNVRNIIVAVRKSGGPSDRYNASHLNSIRAAKGVGKPNRK